MILFLSLVISILSISWFYVWISLISPLELSPTFYYPIFVFFILSLLIQVLRWVLRPYFERHNFLLWATYFSLGFICHLFFGAMAKDILIFISYVLHMGTFENITALRIASVVTISICLIANIWGIRTALSAPTVKKIKLTLEGFKKLTRPLRIVQISDLHVGPMIRKPQVERMVTIAQRLNPDLLVCTGDLVDGLVSELGNDVEPLKNLEAPLGKYYVTGNHEYYWKANEWIPKISQLGFSFLNNTGNWVEYEGQKFWLAGVPDYSVARILPTESSSPIKAMNGNSNSNCAKILLAHQPKSCFEANDAGFDLMLSGHTHHGQFFPVSLIVGFFNPYYKNLNRHENMWIYVSAGTGFWGPPLRLWVPSEITLIEISSPT